MPKRPHARKLVLKKETIRNLDAQVARKIVGGADLPTTLQLTGTCTWRCSVFCPTYTRR